MRWTNLLPTLLLLNGCGAAAVKLDPGNAVHCEAAFVEAAALLGKTGDRRIQVQVLARGLYEIQTINEADRERSRREAEHLATERLRNDGDTMQWLSTQCAARQDRDPRFASEFPRLIELVQS